MKILILLSFLSVTNLIVAQEEMSKPKIDTLYFGKKTADFKNSKTKAILKDFPYLCDKEVDKEMSNAFSFAESEAMTTAMLTELNAGAKSKIFTQPAAIIAVYFCKDVDFGIGTRYYEFLFSDQQQAKLAFQKLESLFHDVSFNIPIGYKSWYYKQSGKILYFVESRMEDNKNAVKTALQQRIERELKL